MIRIVWAGMQMLTCFVQQAVRFDHIMTMGFVWLLCGYTLRNEGPLCRPTRDHSAGLLPWAWPERAPFRLRREEGGGYRIFVLWRPVGHKSEHSTAACSL